jgi:hypothetical protein
VEERDDDEDLWGVGDEADQAGGPYDPDARLSVPPVGFC